jgi:hypothetical protein
MYEDLEALNPSEPPSKKWFNQRTGKTDWYAMFFDELTPKNPNAENPLDAEAPPFVPAAKQKQIDSSKTNLLRAFKLVIDSLGLKAEEALSPSPISS